MMEPNDSLISILKKVTIFASINEECLHRIIKESSFLSFKANDIIIDEGTPATDIYVIINGLTKVILDRTQSPLEICEFGPGNCIGEASVIGILNHSASVIAVEDTDILALSRKTLMNIFDNDKEFFSYLILNIARELARRLHHTDEILLRYTNHDRCKKSRP